MKDNRPTQLILFLQKIMISFHMKCIMICLGTKYQRKVYNISFCVVIYIERYFQPLLGLFYKELKIRNNLTLNKTSTFLITEKVTLLCPSQKLHDSCCLQQYADLFGKWTRQGNICSWPLISSPLQWQHWY